MTDDTISRPPFLDERGARTLGGRVVPVGPPRAGGGGWLILWVLALTVFEGALRKWVFHNSATLRYAAYFSKDILFLFAAFAGMGSITADQRQLVTVILLIALALLLPPVLVNLADTTPVGAVLSTRAYVLLPLCAVLAAGSFRRFEEIDRAVVVVGLFTLTVAILGAVQFRLPSGHFLNRYDNAEAYITVESGHVRATGTFAYMAGMAIMAEAGGWAATYLYLSATGSGRRIFAVAVGVAGVACSLEAMSRHGVILCLLNIAGGIACFRRAKTALGIGLVGLAIYWCLGVGGAAETGEVNPLEATMRRFQGADTVGQRIGYMLDNVYEGMTQWPLGKALGAGQPGGAAAEGMAPSRFGVIENEQGRIIYEVGIPGFLGVYLIRLLVLCKIVPYLWRETPTNRRALYAASCPMILTSFLINMAFNHTSSSMTWCVVALAFAAMQIDAAEQGGSPALAGSGRQGMPLRPAYS